MHPLCPHQRIQARGSWGSHAEQSAALAAASALNRAPGRIVLKSGGSSIWLDAAHFVSAEAAGNYVNVTADGARYFVRSTLSGLEQDLRKAGADVVRCHRSWLVARGRIREITPTGDGDATITLSDDNTVPASRRYRARLE